ncbi:MAG: hypothetical protein JRN21_02740 [Nitrososphaerota archaeon]|nr:hypothetical protein [Nitrososphaerota archaeon]
MGIRRGLVLCGALALLVFPTIAFAQGSNASQVPDIGLGFGPLSVVPVSVGTPIYTAGDSLWVQSYLTSVGIYVSLEAPSGVTTPPRYLGPGSLDLLYVFRTADPSGNWTLLVTGPGFVSTTVQVALAPHPPALVPQFVGSNLTQNLLQLSYAIPPTDSYSMQGCTMGYIGGSVATVQLPSGIGGQMRVALNGTSTSVFLPQVQSAFSGWFELYTPRSYLEGGVVVSQEDLAAQSGTFSVDSASAPQRIGANLSGDLFLRGGRYDLRTYINGPQGLTVFETPFLRLSGGGWVSLAGCSQLSGITSLAFTMKTNLDNANATWPRQIYLMYASGGVDGYTVSNVTASEARIDVRSSSQVAKVPGITVSVTGKGVGSWDFYNSEVYIIGTSYPFTASLDLSFGGVTQKRYNVEVDGPFTTQVLSVPVGFLDVQATSGGGPAANATILVAPTGGAGVSQLRETQGGITLTLPPGEYNVTAVYEGRAASTTIEVSAGETAKAELDLTPPSPANLFVVLMVILAVGVGVNFFVWRDYLGRKEILGKNSSPTAGTKVGGFKSARRA